MKIRAIALAFCVLSLRSYAQDADLAALKAQYEANLVAIEADVLASEAQLLAAYKTALNSLRGTLQTAGELAKLKAALAEIARVEASGTVPNTSPDTPEIKALVLGYQDRAAQLKVSRARRIVTLAAQYHAALDAVKRKLTQEGNLQEAEAAADALATLPTTEPAASARALLSDVSSSASSTQPQPMPDPARLSRPWKPLVGVAWVSAKGGRSFRNNISSQKTVQVLRKDYPPTRFIYAHAPGRIEYRFAEPISEFRASLALKDMSGIGNVVFKLETEAGVVYSSHPVMTNQTPAPIHATFPPTLRLVLVTDDNRSPSWDHALWIDPETR